MFHDCVPDRKWRQYCQLVENKKEIRDPLLQKIDAVRRKTKRDEDIEYVLDLIENPDYRDQVTAFLMSGAELDMVSTWVQVPVPVLELFCELCFNRSEFRNKLEWRAYAIQYASNCAQPEHAELIRSALLLGPSYMMYHFQQGDEQVALDPKNFAKGLIQQAFHLSRVARGNPINSPATKESLRWLNAAAKLLTGYDKVLGEDMNDDDNEALIAIEAVKISRTAEECGLDKDTVMH
jgi:hypothetical protein